MHHIEYDYMGTQPITPHKMLLAMSGSSLVDFWADTTRKNIKISSNMQIVSECFCILANAIVTSIYN